MLYLALWSKKNENEQSHLQGKETCGKYQGKEKSHKCRRSKRIQNRTKIVHYKPGYDIPQRIKKLKELKQKVNPLPEEDENMKSVQNTPMKIRKSTSSSSSSGDTISSWKKGKFKKRKMKVNFHVPQEIKDLRQARKQALKFKSAEKQLEVRRKSRKKFIQAKRDEMLYGNVPETFSSPEMNDSE